MKTSSILNDADNEDEEVEYEDGEWCLLNGNTSIGDWMNWNWLIFAEIEVEDVDEDEISTGAVSQRVIVVTSNRGAARQV